MHKDTLVYKCTGNPFAFANKVLTGAFNDQNMMMRHVLFEKYDDDDDHHSMIMMMRPEPLLQCHTLAMINIRM